MTPFFANGNTPVDLRQVQAVLELLGELLEQRAELEGVDLARPRNTAKILLKCQEKLRDVGVELCNLVDLENYCNNAYEYLLVKIGIETADDGLPNDTSIRQR